MRKNMLIMFMMTAIMENMISIHLDQSWGMWPMSPDYAPGNCVDNWYYNADGSSSPSSAGEGMAVRPG